MGGAAATRGLDLTGSPQYYRVVRLTNAQWARSVQDVLKLANLPGLEQSFETAVVGTTDFSNNEQMLDVNQRSWWDFQTAAETLAAQATATRRGAGAEPTRGTDAAGLHRDAGPARLPAAADDGGDRRRT